MTNLFQKGEFMEKQIRTTLILRNDTSTNWAASKLVLKKGEDE